MQRGYIKIWRKIEDSGLLQMHGTLALFMFILLKAAHKPIKIGTPNGIVELERGQYMSGRHKLSADVSLSEQEIRTCLARLEKLDILRIKSTSRYSIYTVVNYSNYQDTNQQGNQQSTSNQPAINQQLTTKQALQELKALETLKPKDKPSVTEFDQFWQAYPKKTGKTAAHKSYIKHKPPLELILNALAWQKKTDLWLKEDGQFVPNPSTYLNQGRWQDEPTSITNKQSRPQTVQEAQLDCARQIMGSRYGNDRKIIDITASRPNTGNGTSISEIDGKVRQPSILEVEGH